jgi:hypothetical protein
MNLKDVNTGLDELKRIDHECNLLQEIFLAISLVVFFYILIKNLFLMAWDNIPRFGLSIVRIIY